jgi:hypothetical protein
MLIFRGFGAVPALAILFCLAAAGAICDGVLYPREEDYSLHHGWPIALGFVVAGLITLGVDRWRSAKLFDPGHLFFVKPRTWGFLCFGGAALTMLIHYTE